MSSRSQRLGHALRSLPGGAALLARAAAQRDPARAPIFMLHRVLADPGICYDPEMAISRANFERFLAWVMNTYDVVPLAALPDRLARGGAPRPCCALTFDDGWLDTYTDAFPLLARHRLPATVFLPVAFIGTQRHFWQERLHHLLTALPDPRAAAAAVASAALPFVWCPVLPPAECGFDRLRRRLLRRSSEEAEAFVAQLAAACPETQAACERAFMNWDEVAAMQRSGITFGSHTLNHCLLRTAAPGRARIELEESRHRLAAALGAPPATVSYPWGGLSPFTLAQAEAAGYALGVTTQPGLACVASPRLALPRIAISDAQLGWRAGAPAALPVALARARPHTGRGAARGALAAGQRLRVGLLVHDPEPWGDEPRNHLGGSELQLRRLWEALDPRYFEPELYFMFALETGLPRRLSWPVWAAAPARSSPLRMFVSLRRLLRERRPALVQATFPEELLWGVAAARAAGVPAVLCARRNAGYWMRPYHRWLMRGINRLATGWQTNAETVYQLLLRSERIAEPAIELVPNWLDLARFRPASPAERFEARRQLGLPAQAFVAVSVANYAPVKRLDTLVGAAAALAGLDRPVCLLLLGEGSERPGLEARIAAAGVGSIVRLVGAQANVPQWLAAADCGVSTSSSEGCPNAVLEFMAAGLPIVLSDIGAHRALSADARFAVGDASGLARELMRLARDERLRSERGRSLRAWAERYSGDAFAELAQAHYTRAARSGV